MDIIWSSVEDRQFGREMRKNTGEKVGSRKRRRRKILTRCRGQKAKFKTCLEENYLKCPVTDSSETHPPQKCRFQEGIWPLWLLESPVQCLTWRGCSVSISGPKKCHVVLMYWDDYCKRRWGHPRICIPNQSKADAPVHVIGY